MADLSSHTTKVIDIPDNLDNLFPTTNSNLTSKSAGTGDLSNFFKNAYFSFKQKASDPQSGVRKHPAFALATTHVTNLRTNIRPWAQFFDTKKFNYQNLKAGPIVSSRRMMRNIEFFLSNYAVIFAILLVYSLLTSPLILLTLISSLILAHYLGNNKSRIHFLKNYSITNVQIYSLVGLIYTMPLLYFFGAGGLIFYLLGLTCFLIGIHSMTYDLDPELLDIKNNPELLFSPSVI